MPYRSRHDVGTQPVKIRVRPEYAERYPTLDPQKWYPAQSDHSGVLIFLADTSIPSIRADHCELELPYRRSSGTTVREFLHAGRAIYAELLPSRYMPVHVSRRRPRWVVFDPVVGQHWTLPEDGSATDTAEQVYDRFLLHLAALESRR